MRDIAALLASVLQQTPRGAAKPLVLTESINDRIALLLGYRHLQVDYDTSGGFRFDATLHGPGLGLDIRL